MRNHNLWQGQILTQECVKKLGLINNTSSSEYAVIISHDCDLAQPIEKEKFIEIIFAEKIDSYDPQLGYARNPRILHLCYTANDGAPLYLELSHQNKMQIEKQNFLELGNECSSDFNFAEDEKRILKTWLAARYGRPAFPDNFEKSLRKTIGKDTVEKRIAKILEPESGNLIGLFFDLGEARCSELENEPYILSILIVYDAEKAGGAARVAAENVAHQIKTLFHTVYGSDDTATEVALEKCTAIANTLFSLADLSKVDLWRVNYISLKEKPIGQFISAAELPS